MGCLACLARPGAWSGLVAGTIVDDFSGWVAVVAGWYVTEIGRQPWIVDGVLRTADVVADHASATLTGTLLGYVALYVFLLMAYIGALRYLASKPAASLAIKQQPIVSQQQGTEGAH